MHSTQSRSCISIRIFLVSLKYRKYSHLSINVIREISGYFWWGKRVVRVRDDHLTVFDLEKKGKTEEKPLEERFTVGSSFAVWDEENVVGVGDAPATTRVFGVHLPTGNCPELCPLSTKRRFPGVIRFGAFIYAFGSGNRPVLSSCERYSIAFNSWSPLPDMHSGKWAFTPCSSRTYIYLACLHQPIERFDTTTESFETFPISVPGDIQGRGCVSFLTTDTLYILTTAGQMCEWKLRDGAWGETAVEMTDNSVAETNMTPVVYNGYAYWGNYATGKLIKFSLETYSIEN